MAERETVKEAELQELSSKHGEARQQLQMDQNIELHQLMEFWRKKEEEDKAYRRNRGWD